MRALSGTYKGALSIYINKFAYCTFLSDLGIGGPLNGGGPG